MSLFGYNNLGDAGTITNNSDGSNVLPATNVQTRQVGRVFRQTLSATSPLSDVTLDFDLAAAKSISYVGIIGHNIPAGTYTVSLGSSSGGSQVYTTTGTLWQGVTDDQKQQHVILPATYSARYVRVVLKPTVAQTVDVGRIWIDNPWQPDVSIEFDHEVLDESESTRSVGMAVHSYERPRVRVNRITFPKLTEQQALGDSADSTVKNCHAMDITVGTHSPIICIPVTTGQDDNTQVIHKFGIYGSIRRSTPIMAQAAKDSSGGWLYRKSFEVQEER